MTATTRTRILFTVYGEPKPAGSKKAFALRRRDGSLVLRANGAPVVNVTHDNRDTRSWMQAVASAAAAQYDGPLLDGPIRLEIVFERPRPKGHFGTGRNASRVKDSAPRYPTTKPDNTKLRRAIEDALTGVVWVDDSQVVTGADLKRFGLRYQTHVIITALENDL